MGVEFLRIKRQRHSKSWNDHFLRGVPDLFSALPALPATAYRARISSRNDLPSLGETVILWLTDDDKVLVRKSTHAIGSVTAPDPGLVDALRMRGGIAVATVRVQLSRSAAIDVEIDR